MFTKSKIAVASALVALTGSVALAQDLVPNLASRYPAYVNPIGPQGAMRSAPVKLLQGRNARLTIGQTAAQASDFEIDRADRASSPYAGGGF
jgi:hypothetical protein